MSGCASDGARAKRLRLDNTPKTFKFGVKRRGLFRYLGQRPYIDFLSVVQRDKLLLAGLSMRPDPRVFSVGVCSALRFPSLKSWFLLPALMSVNDPPPEQQSGLSCALGRVFYLRVQTKQSYQRFLCGVPSHCDNVDRCRGSRAGRSRHHIHYCCSKLE